MVELEKGCLGADEANGSEPNTLQYLAPSMPTALDEIIDLMSAITQRYCNNMLEEVNGMVENVLLLNGGAADGAQCPPLPPSHPPPPPHPLTQHKTTQHVARLQEVDCLCRGDALATWERRQRS